MNTSADPMTRTRSSWTNMHSRCKPAAQSRKNYADRGITVCARWASFDAFVEDMGLRPEDRTLDRVDNDAGYSPENCRWATQSQQTSNRRCTEYVKRGGGTSEFPGEKKGMTKERIRALIAASELTVKEMADATKVNYQKLYRWVTGKTDLLDLEMADALHVLLTGESLLDVWHRGFTATIDADLAETVYRSLTGKGFV